MGDQTMVGMERYVTAESLLPFGALLESLISIPRVGGDAPGGEIQ